MAKKNFTAQEKLQPVLENLKGNVSAAELCRRYDIWPAEFNRFKQKALEGALPFLS